MAKIESIEKLQNAIADRHGCESSWVESLSVKDVFHGRTIWQGLVEVFILSGHPKAKTAYAWIDQEGEDDTGERVETVLGIPPVESPLDAVQASIIADTMLGL